MKEKRSAKILIAILSAFAHLPLRVMYVLADIAFVLVYYVARYRRRVVDDNLAQCFPDMDQKARAAIRRQFYRNFCDTFVEAVKLLHISDKEICQRMQFENTALIDELLSQGKSVAVYFSHCGNWEWAPSVTLHTTHHQGVEYCQVYRPLRNHAFDALMLRLRSRFGSVSLAKNMSFLDLMRYSKRGMPTITGFMSDQKPSHGDAGRVVHFLNHPTAMITGTETVARRLNAAVVYWDMQKPSRGHYHIDIRLITDAPTQLPDGAITDRYASMLAQTINRRPDIWLWTHNRWKNPVKPPLSES